jgi:sulfotransferase 6B1
VNFKLKKIFQKRYYLISWFKILSQKLMLDILGSGEKILITSIPKSGTHLLEKVFAEFLNYEKFGDGINRLYSINSEGRFSETKKRLSWLPRSAFISSHMFFDDELYQVIINKNIKVILSVRDPRDLVLSAANYIKEEAHPYSPHFRGTSLEEVINQVIIGIDGPLYVHKPKKLKSPIFKDYKHNLQGGIFETCQRFLRWEGVGQALRINFEDLVGSKGGGCDEKQKETILRISEFCSVQLLDIDLDNIKNNLFGESSTFRKGQIGSWKKVFTDENIKIFKECSGDLLVKMGYELDNNW